MRERDVKPPVARDTTTGELSMSVDETNRLRASLGLKPLQEKTAAAPSVNKDKEDAERAERTRAVREKVRVAKERRQEDAFFSQTKKLGEAGSDSDDDIEAWIEKTRSTERQAELKTIQNESSDRLDDDSNVEHDVVPELVGKKVNHKPADIHVGETTILTLADQPILTAKGELNTTEDVLENALKAEEARRQKAYRASKPKKDELYDEYGDKKSLLNKYDEEEEEAMTLDPSGNLELETVKPGTTVKQESLQTSRNLISDYVTLNPESNGEASRSAKRKRQKLRKKGERGAVLDIVAQLEVQNEDAMDWEVDHGSRRDRQEQMERAEKEQSLKKELKSQKFDKALEKANLQTLKLKLLQDGDEDDNDERLYESFNRAQQKVSEQTKTRFQQMAETAQEPMKTSSDSVLDKKLIFTDTTEFCRLFSGENLETKKSTTLDSDSEEMMIGDEPAFVYSRADRRRHLRFSRSTDEPATSEAKDTKGDTGALREPVLGTGLAVALETLRDKGDLKKRFEWVGRTNDMKKSRLIGVDDFYTCGEASTRVEKSIETALTRKDHLGRVLTPKEAFREISYAFHGKGPSQKTMEKRKRKMNEDFLVKKSNLDQESQLARLKAVQKVQKNAFVVLSGNELVGKELKGKKKKVSKKTKPESGPEPDAFPSFTPVLDKGDVDTPLEGKKKVEAMFGIQPKESSS